MGSPIPINNGIRSNECYLCGDSTDYKITRSCIKCQQTFCTEHSSRIDPTYCEHCMLDATITVDSFQRVTEEEEYNEETDEVIKTTVKSPIAKRIRLTGPDWAFHSERIGKLSDDELKLSIQFYKASVSLMEMDLSARNVKKIVMNINDTSSGVVNKTIKDTNVRKVSKIKKPLDLEALKNKMLSLGLTPEDILKMMGGK